MGNTKESTTLAQLPRAEQCVLVVPAVTVQARAYYAPTQFLSTDEQDIKKQKYRQWVRFLFT